MSHHAALAAPAPGVALQRIDVPDRALSPTECRIRVAACGICHSDLHMIDNDWRISRYPLVPGHEAVGIVEAVGAGVDHLKPGARVGVGWQRSACLQCEDCLRGDENLCDTSQGVITDGHGGFAEQLVVDARFAFPLPTDLPTELAGPLMCGGITVYSALIHAARARAGGLVGGSRVGVLGIGGLGHLGVAFAHALGAHVTALTTSAAKADEATRLGADDALLLKTGEPPPKPKRPFDVLLVTAMVDQDWGSLLNTLGSDGTLAVVGAVAKPMAIPMHVLMEKRRRVMASPIGGRADMGDMLRIAAERGVKPQVETFPWTQANDAIARLRAGQVRYRAVLTMGA